MRRFTRLTNGFCKKVENLAHAVSLHFMHYNFARPHASLKKPYPRTPAMAAGVADHVWTLEEIAGAAGLTSSGRGRPYASLWTQPIGTQRHQPYGAPTWRARQLFCSSLQWERTSSARLEKQ